MQDDKRAPKRPDEKGPDELDGVWKALSNAIRRRMLDLMKEGPVSTGEMVQAFPELSRFAVMQHLKVLEEARLLTVIRDGRVRYNYINPVPIQQVYDRWVSRYMQPWTEALTSLKHDLEARDETA